MELHRVQGALWGSHLVEGGSPRKPKGQLGAAQDSLDLETKMLTRKKATLLVQATFGMTAWKLKERMLVLGAETPAQPGQPQLIQQPPL